MIRMNNISDGITGKYDVDRIMHVLKEKEEIIPETHDGCYLLMRATIQAYSHLEDYSAIDFHDLNLVYLTSVGTWKHGIRAKKKTVEESHLLPEDERRLMSLWDEVWTRAGEGQYSNREIISGSTQHIGMFGTGLLSFENKTTADHAREFIRMCVDILPMEDDEAIYNRAEQVLTTSFKGMQAAAASMVLHCLKPYTFPILNSNMGSDNIFEVLGIPLVKWGNLDTYISNCRKIKAFRDENFAFKNYRVFDMAAWTLKNYVKGHKTGRFASWEIIDENTARKICDKTFFQSGGAVVPQEIRWFFMAESMMPGKTLSIKLIYNGVEYTADIQKTGKGADQTRLTWESRLADLFAPYQEDDIQDILEFRRNGSNRYEINVIAEKAWLISWNKNYWDWEDYAQECEETRAGNAFVDSWTCASSSPRLGDDVFLIKLGEQPRGIIGHGTVVRESYKREHYDPDKAAEGKQEKCIDIRFDRLLDYENEQYIPQEELQQKCASQHWSPQNSGIEIKPEVLPALKELWRAVTESGNDDWWPSLSEYDPQLTAQEYHDLFLNEKVVNRSWLESLYEMYKMPGHLATCKQLGERYKHAPSRYISHFSTAASNIVKETGHPVLLRDSGNARYWPVLFVGKETKDRSEGNYCWKMREPVVTAIEMLIEEGTCAAKGGEKMERFDHNMILYGPPGTGKTYSTVQYAVAIIEKKPVETVKNEPYDDVMKRYNQYKEHGRIEFTTFHQSYSYEEFVEGIKPVLDSEDEETGNLQYIIQPGVFKDFCERAEYPVTEAEKGYGLNASPKVWKVSLGGSRENPTREECMKNDHIRIGWDQYGPEIEEETVYSDGGKSVLDRFISRIRIGDIVLSCYTYTTIDAIGVVTGEYEWHDEYPQYKRLRKVKWLVKGIQEDISAINNGKVMNQPSVYKMSVSLADVMSIVEKHGKAITAKSKDDNYVFIIDEINRGNISKIFGELITLIEPTKRIGQKEGMRVTLPYSQHPFGVPDNVYLIGTMNTADRSIALIDTALRRRFQFIEMLPKLDELEGVYVEGVSIKEMLTNMNRKISILYDRDHTIGHACFMPLKNSPTIDTLSKIFSKSIMPLLQEYFYEDYEKIRLVLGDNNKEKWEEQFIIVDNEDCSALFGNTDYDFEDTRTYSVNKNAFGNIEAYRSI